MSRAQQSSTYNQTQGESKGSFGDAENAYTQTQTDIGDYKSALGAYAAENPYTQGGEFQTDLNRTFANNADASATATGDKLQMEAERTGQNPAGAIAATERMQQGNERTLSSQEAGADAERIGSEAGYNKGVLQATAAPAGMEEGVASGYGSLFGKSLGVQEDAAKTPSFWDETGDAFGQALGKGLGSLATGGKG